MKSSKIIVLVLLGLSNKMFGAMPLVSQVEAGQQQASDRSILTPAEVERFCTDLSEQNTQAINRQTAAISAQLLLDEKESYESYDGSKEQRPAAAALALSQGDQSAEQTADQGFLTAGSGAALGLEEIGAFVNKIKASAEKATALAQEPALVCPDLSCDTQLLRAAFRNKNPEINKSKQPAENNPQENKASIGDKRHAGELRDKPSAKKQKIESRLPQDSGAKIFKCSNSFCNDTFNNSMSAEAHQTCHDKDKKRNYSCPIPGCNAGFVVEKAIKKHMQNHDSSIEYIYEKKCKIKAKREKQNIKKIAKVSSRKVHSAAALVTSSIQPKIPYSCKECSEKFKSQDALSAHRDSLHGGSKDPLKKTYRCAQCSTRFNTWTDMVDHAKKNHTQHAAKQTQAPEQDPNTMIASRSQEKSPLVIKEPVQASSKASAAPIKAPVVKAVYCERNYFLSHTVAGSAAPSPEEIEARNKNARLQQMNLVGLPLIPAAASSSSALMLMNEAYKLAVETAQKNK